MIVVSWSFGVALITVGVFAAAFVVWLRPMMQREKDTGDRDRAAAEARARKISKHASPTESEAMDIVRRALAVRTPAEVPEWIRLGPATATEAVDFMKELRLRDGRVAEEIWWGSIDKNGLELEGVELIYGNGEIEKRRLAILTPDERGIWKLDYAAFVRWVNPPWSKLLEPEPDATTGKLPAGEVRIYFVRDRYYNGPFMDEEVWAAYGMVSPDIKDELLVGYCRKGSPQHRAMELMLAGCPDGQVLRATLSVRRVAEAERRQLEITRVLAEDWVTGEQAFDEL